MNTVNNQRHQDTVRRILDAMLALLEEKAFERITVTDICKAADINRSTFYRHYTNPSDLMEQLASQFHRGMLAQWAIEKNASAPITQEALCRMLSYILEHRVFYRVYLHRFRGQPEPFLDDYLLPLFEDHGVLSRRHMEYYYHYVASGFISVISHWLERESPESPEEIAKLLYAILPTPR